jgi:hypothetical protein
MTLPPVIFPYQSSCGPLQKLGRLQSSNPFQALISYIWYFVGLNSIVHSCHVLQSRWEFWCGWAVNPVLNASPQPLGQRSCGPLQIKLSQFMVLCWLEFLSWHALWSMWKLFDVADELWIQYCMLSNPYTNKVMTLQCIILSSCSAPEFITYPVNYLFFLSSQAPTIYVTLLAWISWLPCVVEQVETIWCVC